jgi:hypothetical protein
MQQQFNEKNRDLIATFAAGLSTATQPVPQAATTFNRGLRGFR